MVNRNGRAAAFSLAFGATRALYAGLRRVAPGREDTWRRTNAAGRRVDLYAGPAVALGAAAAGALSPRTRVATTLAVLAAGACGAYDDHAGDTRRGFRAHLAALRHGEVTSGAVKLLGIGAAALTAAALLKERPLDKALAAVVVAGAAHCVNLVDVRPGRAVLSAAAFAAPGMLRRGEGAALAAAPLGAAAAIGYDDLAERTMVGDAGAHALGAALGVAVAVSNGRAGLAAHALGVVAATAYGEWTVIHSQG